MIENFTAYNPTRLHFGNGVIQKLGKQAKAYGSKALIVLGKGSAKKFGYFDQVTDQLRAVNIEVVEYSGIKPNPILEDVYEAIELGNKEKVDMVIALGGGSAIDSAKVIALALGTGLDPWDIVTRKVTPDKTLPLICILTLAATGTEMNGAAVVQNHSTGEKIGFATEQGFPKESFLDPVFTLSVPKNYTAYGIVDLIAHALEAYFGGGSPDVTDQITFAIIKDAMVWGPKLLNNLNDVDLRAKIMLDATLALNGITQYGKSGGDWGVHGIGHQLSMLYDTAHGETLSIAYPAWLKLHEERIPERIIKLGNNLFNVDTVDDTIIKLKTFFQSLGSAVSLTEIGLGKENKKETVELMNKNGVSGVNHQLTNEDHQRIFDLMMR